MKEVGILKKLDHPNIARMLASYKYNHKFDIVLEKCPKGELYEHLKEQNSLNEADTSTIIR